MSKTECLRTDHWQTVSTFLTIRELCRLMCVSRVWFHRWVDDRLWYFQRQRVCAKFPELGAILDEYRATTKKKKRKKIDDDNDVEQGLCIPRKGLWSAFKRLLHKACTMDGIKELCKKPAMHPLVLAVCRLNVPCLELIYDNRVVEYQKRNRRNSALYGVSFWWNSGVYPGHRITFCVRHSCDEFSFEFYDVDSNEFCTSKNGKAYQCYWDVDFFLTWESFLFQDACATFWTDALEERIQASARLFELSKV